MLNIVHSWLTRQNSSSRRNGRMLSKREKLTKIVIEGAGHELNPHRNEM